MAAAGSGSGGMAAALRAKVKECGGHAAAAFFRDGHAVARQRHHDFAA